MPLLDAPSVSSTVSVDLVDLAPGSPLRRTGSSGHQAIQAKAHDKNDPATPKPWLSDRTTQSSIQPSTSAVIFEPARHTKNERPVGAPAARAWGMEGK